MMGLMSQCFMRVPVLTSLILHAGIKFLVDLRGDVRAAIKQSPATAGPLRALDRHLRSVLPCPALPCSAPLQLPCCAVTIGIQH